MSRFRIRHVTEFEYTAAVSLCHNEAHLAPRTLARQRVVSHALHVEPAPATRFVRQDYFGNGVEYFAVEESHESLTVTAVSEVEALPLDRHPLEKRSRASLPWEQARQQLHTGLRPEHLQARLFATDSALVSPTSELADYAYHAFTAERPLVEAVEDLAHRIHADFAFDPHYTLISTPLDQVLRGRRGVCQDFAHLAIGCLRSLGLAARYVSGYLETEPPPGQPRLVGADASHAWVSVFLPGLGWLDIDPTNDCFPSDRHITIAWGRDYSDVSPLKGVLLGAGEHSLNVAVDVERLGSVSDLESGRSLS